MKQNIRSAPMLGSTALFALFLLACGPGLRADVRPGAPFRDGAVLQRGKPIPVWGKASPGERVQVSFHGETAAATADGTGRWRVELGPLAASSESAQMAVAGQNTVTVQDVLVGEVWLCAGQSNMFFTVRAAQNFTREKADAHYATIREFAPNGVAEKTKTGEFDVLIRNNVASQPHDTMDGSWEACSPATVGRFTAVGYFFARELQRRLGPVPIGIVKATLGGSPIEAWLSAEALASDPAFAVVAQRWEKIRQKRLGVNEIREQPSGLYNGLIYPIEPYALAGVLWYQGESNAVRADEYSRLFLTMIRQWRRGFGREDLPFIFVQLPNFGGEFAGPGGNAGTRWALEREAQAAALELPKVDMVVTIDIGDPASLHPANKQEVGRRAALIALAQTYGQKVEASGPVRAAVETEGPAVRVRFTHAAGLHCVGDVGRLFEIAGRDGQFEPAQARLEGESMLVSAAGVSKPSMVRLEWSNAPAAYLANNAGLPAAPFRLPVGG